VPPPLCAPGPRFKSFAVDVAGRLASLPSAASPLAEQLGPEASRLDGALEAMRVLPEEIVATLATLRPLACEN
jgi:hypothetical protein